MGDPDNSFKDINLIVRNQISSTINWHEKDGFTDHQTNANTFILDYKAKYSSSVSRQTPSMLRFGIARLDCNKYLPVK